MWKELTEKKKREKLVNVISEETSCVTSIKRKVVKHPDEKSFDLHQVVLIEHGVELPTRYVLCNHDKCKNDLDKALFLALRDNKKKVAVESWITTRHAERNHHNRDKLINLLATKVIVSKALPLEHFQSDEMKDLLGAIDEKYRDGISKWIIKKNLDTMSSEVTLQIQNEACQIMDENNGTIIVDGYQQNGIHYLGVLLLSFNSERREHDKYLLAFRRVDIQTDEAVRAHVREVLVKFGIEKFFDEKRLLLTGDNPIKHAFDDQISVSCKSHDISNVAKNYIRKNNPRFKSDWNETIAAVSAFCKSKKREGCDFQSLNDAIKDYIPTTDEEIAWIELCRGHRPDNPQFLCLEGLNLIRFRSAFNVFERLQLARPFIQENNRMLYADGHEVSWGLVEYMSQISKIFLPAINFADSDGFMLGDGKL